MEALSTTPVENSRKLLSLVRRVLIPMRSLHEVASKEI
jgi:hypothetical protein